MHKYFSSKRIRISDLILYLVSWNDIILYCTRRSWTPSPGAIYPAHVATPLCLIGWLLCWWLSRSKACCRPAQTDARKWSFQQSSPAQSSSLLCEMTLCWWSSVWLLLFLFCFTSISQLKEYFKCKARATLAGGRCERKKLIIIPRSLSSSSVWTPSAQQDGPHSSTGSLGRGGQKQHICEPVNYMWSWVNRSQSLSNNPWNQKAISSFLERALVIVVKCREWCSQFLVAMRSFALKNIWKRGCSAT